MVSQPAILTLSDVLATAFPRTSEAGAAAPVEALVHLIPQAGEPRWIVIGDTTRAAVPVLQSWRPFKASSRLRWNAVIGAAHLNVLSRLPGVVTTREAIDLSYWRRSLPGITDGWRLVMHIGNASRTRKVTIVWIAPDRGVQAVAKVPLMPAAFQAILNEAAVLQQLAGADYLPAGLFQDPQRGIAAQTWLHGQPVSRVLTPAHMDLLARLAVPDAAIRVSDQRVPIAAELERADLPFDRDVLSRALELLDYDQPLPAFLEHRDFAPWNLKLIPGNRIGAIDWEWATLCGLPCQDIFRYFYIQDALLKGPGDAWRRLNRDPLVQEHYRRFSIPPEALPALAMYYQLRVLAMEWQIADSVKNLTARRWNQFLSEYAFRQIESLLELAPVRTPQML